MPKYDPCVIGDEAKVMIDTLRESGFGVMVIMFAEASLDIECGAPCAVYVMWNDGTTDGGKFGGGAATIDQGVRNIIATLAAARATPGELERLGLTS